MRRLGLALGALLIAAPTAGQAQTSPARRLRVAVMDLSGSALKMQTTTMPMAAPMPPQAYPTPGATGQQTTVSIAIPPPSEFARGLTEMLTSVLSKTGRFVVLERAAMQQMEQEQSLGAAGKVTKESAAQQGALLGAQALITGDITGFSFQRSSIGGELTNLVKGLTIKSERVSAEVVLDLRLIDATTGEVLYSTKGTGKASQTGVAADLTKAEKSYSADAELTTPLGQASRAAIQNAVAGLLLGMAKVRWSGRVVDVRGGVVYVNAAASDGMRPGLELDVYEAQPPLVDPETGKSLGSPEKYLGTVAIESVLEKFSTAKIVSGDGIAKGQVLRLKGDKAPQ
jgi:curli biogenesis system outer membrane secretion channel CsgG